MPSTAASTGPSRSSRTSPETSASTSSLALRTIRLSTADSSRSMVSSAVARARRLASTSRSSRRDCDRRRIKGGGSGFAHEADFDVAHVVDRAVVAHVGPAGAVDRHLLEVAQLPATAAVDAAGADHALLDGG